MNKVITALQSNLYTLEKKEYEAISKASQDEAIRIALSLANHPAPPMPAFDLDPKYEDAEKLADVVDDIFGRLEDDKERQSLDLFNYETDSWKEGGDFKEEPSFSDSEAISKCTEWKTQYKVIVGVSWGDLPIDLQQKWLEYSCDYHLNDF